MKKKLIPKNIKPMTDLQAYWNKIHVPAEFSIDPMPMMERKIKNFSPIGPYFWFIMDLHDFSFSGLGGDTKKMLGIDLDDLLKMGGDAMNKFIYKEDFGYNLAYNHFCWQLLTNADPEERKHLICTYTVRIQNRETKEIKWILVQYVDWIIGKDGSMYYVLITVTDISHLSSNEKVKLIVFDSSNDERTVYYTHTPSEETPEKKPLLKFTARQKEIIKLISKGYASKQIANILNISVHTVSNHRSKIMKMADVPNSAAILVFASQNGLL